MWIIKKKNKKATVDWREVERKISNTNGGLLGIVVHPAHQLWCLANGHGIWWSSPEKQEEMPLQA